MEKQEIMNQLKITAMAYGMKRMAEALNKPYSTLANELNEVEWAKSGFRDVLSIIHIALGEGSNSQARMAAGILLDMVGEAFGRVVFVVPELTGDMTTEMMMIAKLSKEYGQLVEKMADAMADGKWDHPEIADCLKLSRSLLQSALPIYKYMNGLHESRDRRRGPR